jgi:hypothetical protein
LEDFPIVLPDGVPPFPDAGQLAKLLKVTRPTVCRWVANGTITEDALIRITSRATRFDLRAVLGNLKKRALPRRDTSAATRASLESPRHPSKTARAARKQGGARLRG